MAAAAIAAAKQDHGASADRNDDFDLKNEISSFNHKLQRAHRSPGLFQRLEDYTQTEEGEKNWKGLIIALGIILAIIGVIAVCVVHVLPEVEKYDPGEPFTLGLLSSDFLKRPVFSWVKGTSQYVLYKHGNHSEKYTESLISLINPSQGTETVIVPSSVIAQSFRDINQVMSSSDCAYVLIRQYTESNSVTSKSLYQLYRRNPAEIRNLDSDGVKVQFATWYNNNQLVYVKNYDIYYKLNLESSAIRVTNDGSSMTLNGLPSLVYKKYIFTRLESLIWISNGNKFAFAKIVLQEHTTYSSTEAETITIHQQDYKPEAISLHVFNGSSTIRLNISQSQGYVTSVSWTTDEYLFITYLSADHQKEQYLFCNSDTGECRLAFEYSSSVLNLHWIGLYGDPIFNSKRNEFYTILPDPAQKDRLYRHIVSIKVDKSKKLNPKPVFLTSYSWSDNRLLGVDDNLLYYLSSGPNYTHQHLYSLNVVTQEANCVSCKLLLRENITYVDAELSPTMEHIFLSVIGPNLPSYHMISTKSLIAGNSNDSLLIDKERIDGLNSLLTGIHLPLIEYLSIPLEQNIDASIKLILPPQFNRKKVFLYRLLLILNESPNSQIATQAYNLGFHEFLAKNLSYIVALIDGRGSSGQGEIVHQSIYGRLGSVEAADLVKITSFLAENFENFKIDLSSVAVFGKGYGGFAALHAVSKMDLQCGIVVSPLSSLNSYSDWLTVRYMQKKSGETELNYDCHDSSPCSVPRTTSILIVHGTDDMLVPVESSLQLIRSLQLAGYGFKQQIYPEKGHELASSDIGMHYYHTMATYLEECFAGLHNHTT